MQCLLCVWGFDASLLVAIYFWLIGKLLDRVMLLLKISFFPV